MSHNNICERNLFINTKFIWKLNGFELSSSFQNTKKDWILAIKPFKAANLTPEEESEKLDYLDKGQAPYSLDVYSWALMFNEILLNSQQTSNDANDSDCKFLKSCLETNAEMRPRIDAALDLNLFKSSKIHTSINNTNQTEHNKARKKLLDEQMSLIEEFNSNEKFNNEKENECADKLVAYLKDLSEKIDKNEKNYEFLVNENFINFLLQPFMFFSEKIRKFILPAILIPKSTNESGGSRVELNSFINENKYTAYVLPHILSLFLLKILIVRLVLLDYFQHYIYFIKNTDTLRHEILPEYVYVFKSSFFIFFLFLIN